VIFFCLFILACDLYRSRRRTFYPIFLCAVRTVAARCKLPFALRPCLSEENNTRRKENTKEIAREGGVRPLPFVRRCHDGEHGQEEWQFLLGTQFPRSTRLLRLRLPFLFSLPALPELPL